ncbi:MAG: PDZ domain-containing protein [Cyclobacteriaceae bacterium]
MVNLRGELVGINTAIATPNGSYAGYSFAVPVALVTKVMDDLLEFGKVQRGLLGIRISDVNAQFADQRDLGVVSGVFVSMVNENSAALDAGIEKGDVITGINGITVTNVSELQELVARNRPGDEVEVTFIRRGEVLQTTAMLKDYEGNTTVQRPELRNDISGAVFEELSGADLEKYEIDGGVRIVELGEGPWKDAGVETGLIITRIDKVKIDDLEDLNRSLKNKNGAFLLEGIYENGDHGIFGVTW